MTIFPSYSSLFPSRKRIIIRPRFLEHANPAIANELLSYTSIAQLFFYSAYKFQAADGNALCPALFTGKPSRLESFFNPALMLLS